MATNYNYFGGIVTQGLVLDLDAAKLASYPGSGTTWYDISGNNLSGSLINGPTFSGIGKQASIVFDDSDDYYSIANNPSLDCANGVSVFMWIKSPSSYRNKQILMKYPSINIGIPYGFQWWSDQNIYFQVTTSTGWKEIQGSTTYSLNTWYNIGLTYDQTTLKSYINTSVSSSAHTGTINTNSYPIINSTGMGGAVANIAIYNRALSAAEVSQNFNALRGRYGI